MRVADLMQRNVVSVAEDESLGLALQLMLWNEMRHLPVQRAADGAVTGVISERDILRAQQAAGQEVMRRQVRAFMSTPAEHIHPTADVADVAANLVQKRISCLPVLEAGELVGIITASDLLGNLAQYPADRAPPRTGETNTVAAIMRREPLSAHASEPLIDAAARMLNSGIRHLCVLDGDQRVIGVLSDRDLRRVFGNPWHALHRSTLPEAARTRTVGTVMTPYPRTLDRDAPIESAVDALLHERIGALPVVDDADALVGIVSYVDVIRYLWDRDRQLSSVR